MSRPEKGVCIRNRPSREVPRRSFIRAMSKVVVDGRGVADGGRVLAFDGVGDVGEDVALD